MPSVAIALPFAGLATAYSLGARSQSVVRMAAPQYTSRSHDGVRMAAPQYTSQAALVTASRPVCPNGCTWLLQLSGQDEPTAYEPGHVLAVEVEYEGATLKGPYTVTRSDSTKSSIDCIYRVIEGTREANGDHVASGMRKTHVFKALEPGAAAAFGGSFHVPILRGIAPAAQHAFLVSTGAGVGPMIGFIEQCIAMWQGKTPAGAPGVPFPPCALERVTLFAGYRELGDVICADELEALVAASAGRFEWHACISGEASANDAPSADFSRLAGRSSSVAPPRIASALSEGFKGSHFHLIGNGAMVKEWQAALSNAGAPEEQVTVEMYFGHRAEPDPLAIEKIEKGLVGLAMQVA